MRGERGKLSGENGEAEGNTKSRRRSHQCWFNVEPTIKLHRVCCEVMTTGYKAAFSALIAIISSCNLHLTIHLWGLKT